MKPAPDPAPDPAVDSAVGEPGDSGYRRPRDPAEIWLARQWQNVLGFAVGVRENVFGVGGNSLTEHPTIENLATLLRPTTQSQP